ncbi:dihydropteroate synthase [Tuberibacillus sp. Marseille-P3662]|uniref:dihydropteroate synthase n=1 Tax=Tuberibacillus sp. Marseille-P3662 TaxID=1965358 RepID=UPI000A1CA431
MTLQIEGNQCLTLHHGRYLPLGERTLVMGILNVTPDSFSDGGSYDHVKNAVSHAQEMIAQGADIIDIGGESTRPGADFTPLDIELERILPAIAAIREFTDIPISIDTYKAETARQALEAGADIINDVWGAKADPAMAEVAANTQAPIILMHNRHDKNYQDLLTDVKDDLQASISLVQDAGVADDRIILDPGIGFAKTYHDNLEVMRRLDEFHQWGYPVLLGTSRKSFIGQTLGTDVSDRLEGTGATVCLGVSKGCQIVRVHDVGPIKKMTNMMDAMLLRG